MVKFLNNVELIVSDFCLTQQEGVRKAIRIFCLENKIEIQVDSLFSACLFHFGQSALRKKKKVRNQELFENFIQMIKKSKNYYELQKNFENLKS